MAPLLALAVGYVLAKMFDVFKRGEGGAPQAPPAPSPHPATPAAPARRRPAATSRRPAVPPPPKTEQTALARTTPVPWPQVVPSGLPAFPGAGWEPDEPPPGPVVARAVQLLPALWAGGEGTFKPEQTAGRWIIYRASNMGGKKGVVAFRESQHANFLTPPESSASETAPASTSTSRTALPTLRRGSKGEEVRILQRHLNLLPADGDFGPATEAAVKNFQGHNGLDPDGVVGPKTWVALMGSSA